MVDFGLRRMHGTDAGMKGARAYHIAGVDATSNVLAGRVYDVPITGTMAHSYVEAHASELEAFRAFAGLYPRTTLLVDTYDTLEGVRRVITLADELGEAVTESVGSEGPTLIDVGVRTDEPSAAEAADYDSTVDLP